MKIDKILHIPWAGKPAFQKKTAISLSGYHEIKALAGHYDVTVFGKADDWGVDGVRYIDHDINAPLGYLNWGPAWEKVLKLVKNDTLVITHAPFTVPTIYTRKFVPGFQFPKILIRYHSDPIADYSGFTNTMFLVPSLTFPSIFGSTGAMMMQKRAMVKSGLNVTKPKNWFVSHPVPIDLETIDAAKPLARESEHPVVQVASINLLVGNRIEEIVEVAEKLYVTGRQFVLHFNVAGGYGKKSDNAAEELKVKERPFISLNNDPQRDMYFREIKTRDVFLSWTTNHTGGVTFIEMLLAGMVGIFWKADYVNEKVDPAYPFIVSNKQEAATMLDWVLNNLDEARERIKPIVENMRKMYSLDSWEDGFLDIVDKTIHDVYGSERDE